MVPAGGGAAWSRGRAGHGAVASAGGAGRWRCCCCAVVELHGDIDTGDSCRLQSTTRTQAGVTRECGWVQSPLPCGAAAPALRCAGSTRIAASLHPLVALAKSAAAPASPRPYRAWRAAAIRRASSSAHQTAIMAGRPGRSTRARRQACFSPTTPPAQPSAGARGLVWPSRNQSQSPLPPITAHAATHVFQKTFGPPTVAHNPLSPFGCATAALPCRLRMLPRAPAPWS